MGLNWFSNVKDRVLTWKLPRGRKEVNTVVEFNSLFEQRHFHAWHERENVHMQFQR